MIGAKFSSKNLTVKKVLTIASAILMFLLASISPIIMSSNITTGGEGKVYAQKKDVGTQIACYFGPESPIASAAQFAFSPEGKFFFRSKSVSGPSVSTDSVYMMMLDAYATEPEYHDRKNYIPFTGSRFIDVNRRVLGTSADYVGLDYAKDPFYTEGTFNGGKPVTPYDRFGVEGLTFTSYMGEWHYMYYHICDENSDPIDINGELYYDSRLVPKTTYDYIDETEDARTIRFRAAFFEINSVVLLNFANLFFGFAKFFTSLAITAINFAFLDLTDVPALAPIIVDTPNNASFYRVMHNAFFVPFATVALGITGFSAFLSYSRGGSFKRSLFDILRSVGTIALAIFLAQFPTFVVTTPIRLTVMMQSVILESLSGITSDVGGICANANIAVARPDENFDYLSLGSGSENHGDAGASAKGILNTLEQDARNSATSGNDNKAAKYSEYTGSYSTSSTKVKSETGDLLSFMETSKRMRASIACKYWEILLFKPWVEGQFGTEWTNLWANVEGVENQPGWTENSRKINNSNGEWVGDAGVPMGGGTWMNNWAIYQISTQTPFHAPTGKEGYYSGYASGRSRDWWRIVDALSNYNEEEKQVSINGTIRDSSTYTVPARTYTSPYWDVWGGFSNLDRVGTAFVASILSLVVVAGPMALAFVSMVYAMTIMLAMMMLPAVLIVVAMSKSRGQDIFAQWGQAVLNLSLKRIIIGLALSFIIAMTLNLLESIKDAGWIQTAYFIALITFATLKTKEVVQSTFRVTRMARKNLVSPLESEIQHLIVNKRNRLIRRAGYEAGFALAEKTSIITKYDPSGSKKYRYVADFSRPALDENGEQIISAKKNMPAYHAKFKRTGLIGRKEFIKTIENYENRKRRKEDRAVEILRERTKEEREVYYVIERKIVQEHICDSMFCKNKVASFNVCYAVVAKPEDRRNVFSFEDYDKVMVYCLACYRSGNIPRKYLKKDIKGNSAGLRKYRTDKKIRIRKKNVDDIKTEKIVFDPLLEKYHRKRKSSTYEANLFFLDEHGNEIWSPKTKETWP